VWPERQKYGRYGVRCSVQAGDGGGGMDEVVQAQSNKWGMIVELGRCVGGRCVKVTERGTTDRKRRLRVSIPKELDVISHHEMIGRCGCGRMGAWGR
jgi:hypothetical protein